jgi:hypothetical protein
VLAGCAHSLALGPSSGGGWSPTPKIAAGSVPPNLTPPKTRAAVVAGAKYAEGRWFSFLLVFLVFFGFSFCFLFVFLEFQTQENKKKTKRKQKENHVTAKRAAAGITSNRHEANGTLRHRHSLISELAVNEVLLAFSVPKILKKKHVFESQRYLRERDHEAGRIACRRRTGSKTAACLFRVPLFVRGGFMAFLPGLFALIACVALC